MTDTTDRTRKANSPNTVEIRADADPKPLFECGDGMHWFPSRRHICVCGEWRLAHAVGWFTDAGLAKEGDALRVDLRTSRA